MPVDAYTAPFHIHAGSQRTFLVVCDHASNALPDEYGSLGLTVRNRQRHIAWDVGARGVALALARKLDCPAVIGGTSRLLIDLNRGIDDASSILAESDGSTVPGNRTIGNRERAARVRQFHAPYHAWIDAYFDEQLALGVRPTLVSVHSFSARLGNCERPWPVAILWHRAREPVAALIDWFAAHGYRVGDNQPYDARILPGWTLEHHALRRDLLHALFEVRSNEIETSQQQEEWGARLHQAIVETRFGNPGAQTRDSSGEGAEHIF